jgi:hypothetical protein
MMISNSNLVVCYWYITSLTHGYQTAKKKISSSAIYFESFPYHVDMVRRGSEGVFVWPRECSVDA